MGSEYWDECKSTTSRLCVANNLADEQAWDVIIPYSSFLIPILKGSEYWDNTGILVKHEIILSVIIIRKSRIEWPQALLHLSHYSLLTTRPFKTTILIPCNHPCSRRFSLLRAENLHFRAGPPFTREVEAFLCYAPKAFTSGPAPH